jgi:hypothetical protein
MMFRFVERPAAVAVDFLNAVTYLQQVLIEQVAHVLGVVIRSHALL